MTRGNVVKNSITVTNARFPADVNTHMYVYITVRYAT